MTTLYFLVGIPASGKTTWAKERMNVEGNIVHLSSDLLRVELYNNVNDREHNAEVFNIMNKRTKDYLKNGTSVIYDATNISSKRRVNFVGELKKIDCKKVCIYFAINPNMCMNNDCIRDRQVGDEVIEKMYKNLQIPMYYEGWDEIVIIGKRSDAYKFELDDIDSYEKYINFLSNPITRECINFAQDNPHHTLNVSRHMYYAYKNIEENSDNKYLKIAILLQLKKGRCLLDNSNQYMCIYNEYQTCIEQDYRSGKKMYCISPCAYCKYNKNFSDIRLEKEK